eukprot:983465-Prorocentrum_minimum.AAC.1
MSPPCIKVPTGPTQARRARSVRAIVGGRLGSQKNQKEQRRGLPPRRDSLVQGESNSSSSSVVGIKGSTGRSRLRHFWCIREKLGR